MWYAGIDWADNHHDAVVLDDAGHIVLTLHVAHSVAGLAQLTCALEQLCGPTAKKQIACIVETNRGLLISALLEAGFAVYPVNPKTVDRRRNAAGVKTDQIDAYLLAKTGRSDLADPRPGQPDPDTDPTGQSTHRLSQSLLSSRLGIVQQTASAFDPGLLARLSHT
jgi:transposase